ncbi:AbiU2 domain-containing protein [Marinirhabdus gelatinilytica]|uniref:Uncharacterized protein n=1 Tax=Marinirhabdus gelatinilytica TaxID=1703343 RepID=A0A370QFC0_9FLAO|nr:hypothetical protein [Marinirhabdus gelatinilytica]RDK86979.1 hypothetical protein C8D94_102157 [Marinirhabdus gelatinilytica]
MMIDKKEKLERYIKIVSNILFKTQEHYLIVEYLMKSEEDDQAHYEKKMNSYFHYSRYTNWQMTVIEISKLFIEREKFSIQKLIKKFRNDGEFKWVGLDERKIDIWFSKINTYGLQIENLKLQRDKLYAHEDGVEHEIKGIVKLSDIDALLEIAHDVVKEVRFSLGLSLMDRKIMNSPAENLKYSIDRLVKEKRTYMEGYRKLAKQYDLESELD